MHDELKRMLEGIATVLVIDWPSKDVPETLALAGFQVIVRNGPKPENHSAYEVEDGRVISRPIGHPPEGADLVYCYRPLSELPGIVTVANALGASVVWMQSGFSEAGVRDLKGCWVEKNDLRSAKKLVESAGLTFVHEPYIADIARKMRALP